MPPMSPKSSLLKRYLPQARVRITQSLGTALGEFGVIIAPGLGAVAAADQEEVLIAPLLTASMTLSATPRTALWPKPTRMVLLRFVCGEAWRRQRCVDHRCEVPVGDMRHSRPGHQPAGEDACLVGFASASGCSWWSSGWRPGKRRIPFA